MKTSDAKKALPVLLPVPAAGENAAKIVGEEILHRNLSPGSWAKALVAAGENDSEPTREYARIRLAELTKQDQHRRAKAESLERRRLRTGSGVRSVKDLLERGGRHPMIAGVNRPGASVMWVIILLFGTAGSIGCLLRLFDYSGAITVIALSSGALVAGLVLLLWAVLPKDWVHAGYNLGLGSATAFTCMLSLLLGIKLMTIAPQQWCLLGNRIVPVSQPATESIASDGLENSVDGGSSDATASLGLR